MISKFVKTLFDDGECTSWGDLYASKVRSADEIERVQPEYFCINALDGEQDRAPTKPEHSSNRPRRANANVVTFRNVLMETDSLPLAEQMDYAQSINLPFSTATYSGNKSIHFILSLNEPCADSSEYSQLVNRLYLGFGKDIDKACKNPSRLSRFPGSVNAKTGNEQKLIHVGARIAREQVEEWLVARGVPQTLPQFKRIAPCLASAKSFHLLSPKTKYLLAFGLNMGLDGTGRRTQVAAAVYDMRACGFSEDDVLSALEDTMQITPSRAFEALDELIDYVFSRPLESPLLPEVIYV